MALTLTIIRTPIILLILFCIGVGAKSNELAKNIPVKAAVGTTKFISRHQPVAGKQNVASISRYVKLNATGNNDGTSWQDAFTSLTIALDNAVIGDTIRVAKGIYMPGGPSFILKDGVVILGGYPNTGNPAEADRNFAVNQTILSGETGNPAIPFDNLSTIISANLVRSGTVLDGFIVENGFANNTLQGVGLNLWRSSPEIRNCVFRNNSSYNSALGGSAIACQNNSNPIITNCFFTDNFDFGFSTFFAKANCHPKLINCVFSANNGRFVVYANQSNVAISNCTFFNNQIGVSYLPGNVVPGVVYSENTASVTVANTVFYNNKYLEATNTPEFSMNGTKLILQNSITQNYNGGAGNFLSVNPAFKDTASVAGEDNLYFTNDDGLQLKCYSPAINAGTNALIADVLFDVIGHPRTYDGLADIGAYEYQQVAGNQILAVANDSAIANREYTDQEGWTHYYQDCLLLLSVKKAGQPIGSVGDGTFKVVVKTTPGYGAAVGNDLSPATYVSPGISWTALNRYWKIQPSTQPSDSLLIRFPWSGKDFADATSINPDINAHDQLVFFTVDSPYSLLGLDVPPADFHPYFGDAAPSSETWKYSTTDTIQFAEYYVKKLSGGGIGTGTGLNKGPFALAGSSCPGANKIYKSSIIGSLYQWQLNTGNGFADITDDALYNGSNTNTLTIIAPPSSTYGYAIRCMVTGLNGTEFTEPVVLKFEARWSGAVSVAWDEPANWNCGILPDENTDVVVAPGTPFNLEINIDITCRSLHLLPNSIATVLDGKIVTIKGK